MRIDQTFSSLSMAARALYSHLSLYPGSRAYLFSPVLASGYRVIDYRTFREQLSTSSLSHRTPTFFGSITDLAQLSTAIPPELFIEPSPQTPLTPETEVH